MGVDPLQITRQLAGAFKLFFGFTVAAQQVKPVLIPFEDLEVGQRYTATASCLMWTAELWCWTFVVEGSSEGFRNYEVFLKHIGLKMHVFIASWLTKKWKNCCPMSLGCLEASFSFGWCDTRDHVNIGWPIWPPDQWKSSPRFGSFSPLIGAGRAWVPKTWMISCTDVVSMKSCDTQRHTCMHECMQMRITWASWHIMIRTISNGTCSNFSSCKCQLSEDSEAWFVWKDPWKVANPPASWLTSPWYHLFLGLLPLSNYCLLWNSPNLRTTVTDVQNGPHFPPIGPSNIEAWKPIFWTTVFKTIHLFYVS